MNKNMKQISTMSLKRTLNEDHVIKEENEDHEDHLQSKSSRRPDESIDSRDDPNRIISAEEKAFREKIALIQNKKFDEHDNNGVKVNSGTDFMRRLSIQMPSALDKKGTLNAKSDFMQKQSTLVPLLSRRESIRALPNSVRQATLVNQVLALNKQITGKIDINEKIDTKEKEKEKKELKEKKQREIIRNIDKLLDSTPVIVIMGLVTVFVLIGDDIKSIAAPYWVDEGFDIAKTICFAFFWIEIFLSSIAKADYLWSFFFWLDILSTVSLFQDIGFMIDPLVYGEQR